MSKIRVSAKTKEEAITKALIQLSTTSDRLEYNVLVEGKTGLFGIGAKPWIIEASVKEASAPSELDDLEKEIHNIAKGNVKDSKQIDQAVNTAVNVPKADTGVAKTEETTRHTEASSAANESKKNAATEYHRDRRSKHDRHDDNRNVKRGSSRQKFPRGGYEVVETPVDDVKEERKQHVIKPISEEEAETAKAEVENFITSVLKGMNMDVQLRSSFNHETNELLVNMEGPDMGILIGKRGQTLDSLQYLSSLVVNKNHKEDYIRVKLDTEDYRSRRETTLKNLARNIAYKVKRSRKAVALEPMNPYERRIIHSALQNDRFVTTKSEGEEPFRHVIIYMKKNQMRDHKDGRRGQERRVDAQDRSSSVNIDKSEANVENTEA